MRGIGRSVEKALHTQLATNQVTSFFGNSYDGVALNNWAELRILPPRFRLVLICYYSYTRSSRWRHGRTSSPALDRVEVGEAAVLVRLQLGRVVLLDDVDAAAIPQTPAKILRAT